MDRRPGIVIGEDSAAAKFHRAAPARPLQLLDRVMPKDLQSSTQKLLSDLAGAPRWYLHQINWPAERAYLIEVDRDFYRRAAFLDDRALAADTKGRWVPLDALRSSVLERHPLPVGVCHFIFHVGHCGSTLISQLLDSLPSVLALREPAPLRGLADAHSRADRPDSLLGPGDVARDLDLVYRMLARRFSPEETPIVKTTSICGCLGPALLSFNEFSKALLLSMGLETYLAHVLSHPGHLSAARGLAPIRVRSLVDRVDADDLRLYRLSAGQLVALAWVAEVVNLEAIQSRVGAARAIRMDFDAFLDAPAPAARRIFEHFSLSCDEATLQGLVGSELFSRYSKRPDQPFSPQDRRDRLHESRRRNGAAIAAGIDFALALAERFDLVAGAIKTFDPTLLNRAS